MTYRLSEVAASAVGLFVVGFVLWPPHRVYWTALADVIGGTATAAIVLIVAGLIGVGIAALSDVSLASLAGGGAIAYVVGMAAIQAAMSPASPAHLFLYAWLLGCLLVGAALERYLREGTLPLVDR